GAEAMHGKLPWNGFIDDNPEKFSSSAVQLYTNKKIWLNAQQNGVTIINRCYSKERFSIKFLKKIKFIQNNRFEHRLHNFIGAMLMRHTLRSTKYLSKWIEEKNK
ncbi:MAG: glycosyltransferase, partial [Lutibacter sp.]|nr:glycosyltransferase [Lutibacter sp.]